MGENIFPQEKSFRKNIPKKYQEKNLPGKPVGKLTEYSLWCF